MYDPTPCKFKKGDYVRVKSGFLVGCCGYVSHYVKELGYIIDCGYEYFPESCLESASPRPIRVVKNKSNPWWRFW